MGNSNTQPTVVYLTNLEFLHLPAQPPDLEQRRGNMEQTKVERYQHQDGDSSYWTSNHTISSTTFKRADIYYVYVNMPSVLNYQEP